MSEKKEKGYMREMMPITASILDELKKHFGEAFVQQRVRQGMRGEPVFFASENGHEIGTPVFKIPATANRDGKV
jgi:hypothetical protein